MTTGSIARPNTGEMQTITTMIYDLLQMKPVTIDELTETLLSEPYSLGDRFGLNFASRAIAEGLNKLQLEGVLYFVFKENTNKIKVDIVLGIGYHRGR